MATPRIYRMRFFFYLLLLTALPILCLADLSTAPITTEWIPRVSRKMVKFAESQTGALQLVKAYDEKINFTEIQIDGKAQLHLLTQAAGDRLKKCREILERNKAEIEASYAQGPTGGAPASDCCDNLGQLEYDPRFLQQITNDSCASFTAGTGDNTVRPHVYDTMKSNLQQTSGVTWQYYGAKEGEYHQFPKNDRSCEDNDHRFRNWYVSAASPKKKNVVIVMDVSGSMREPPGPEEQNRLNLAKQAALTVLDTLTPRDWGGVVSFSARAEAPEGCLGDSLGEANPTNIGIMKDFINQRVPETITVYAEGFKKAFNMFHEAKNKKPEQFEDCYNIIIFLTDGQPTDTYFSLDDIVKGQDLMERSVHIFTYGLGASLQHASSGWANVWNDPNNPWGVRLPALDFLATLADQNNHQIPGAVEWTNRYCENGLYGSCFSANRDPQGVGPWGRTEYIDDNEGDKLKTLMGSYYDFFPFSSNPEPTYSVPTNDKHLGLVINAALPTIDTAGTLFGVTAVDISMDVVFREIANFNIGNYSYAFLVDRGDGRVLIHRNLPKPMEWRLEPTFLGLEAMEEALRSREVTKILNGDSGDYYTMVKVPIARGNAQFDGAVTIEKAATFYFEPIPDTKYSVVLCLFEDDETIAIPTPVKHENSMDDLYHRLDLLYMNNATGDTQFCSLYGEYATPDNSTFKFPPEAFVDPTIYLGTLETFEDVVDIEIFINDFAGFVANPGLLDGVRTDAILSAEIEQYWRENGQESVWRYFGTENGVFRIFPGIITDKRYDPTRQTWYARALSRPQDYTFSRPAPSPFGGGNMVTISRVIAHTKTEELLGVIAADITEKYYYSMLYSEVPECLSDEYDCFLLDDSGYFMESLDNTTIYFLSTFTNNTRNMEHDHLTHRFPWLAKELIMRGEYLRSEWCNNYATQNSQMFYDTTGFIGLEVTTGPLCNQYALHPINSTNTFILTLHNRHTYNCDDRPITVGGNQVWDNSQNCSCNDICQTCSTEELQFCQCPCVCDWNYESCTNEILRLLSDIPCPSPPKDLTTLGPGPPYPPGPEVEECEEKCSAQSDNITCEALPHCVWREEMDFPICTENIMVMETLFECANFGSLSPTQQRELFSDFESKLHAMLPVLPQKNIDITSFKIVDDDTITFVLQGTMQHASLQQYYSTIRQELEWAPDFRIGTAANPNSYRSRGLDDYTNLRVQLIFDSTLDLDPMLANDLTLRGRIQVQMRNNLVTASITPAVLATLGDIWVERNVIPFTISKPADDLTSLLDEADKLRQTIAANSVIFNIDGATWRPVDMIVNGSFDVLCPQPCQDGTDRDSCTLIPGCDWADYDNPVTCLDDAYLIEHIDMSAYFPCLFVPVNLNGTSQLQQDVADSFLSSLRAALQNRGFQVPEKVIHAVQVGRDTIDFRIQSTMGYQNLTGLRNAIRDILSWDQEFTFDGFRSANPDDKFNNTVKFEISFEDQNGGDIDFDAVLESNFTLRDVLEQDIINFVIATLGPSPVATLNLENIWIQSNYCTFSISVPLDQVHAIGAEALQIVNNIGNFIIHVGSLQIQAIKYETTESCDFCPPVCAPRDELACYQHTLCEWCVFEGSPHCGADCLLQEETKEELSVFFPCLPEVIDHQTELQIQNSFRDEVLQLLRDNFNGFNTSRNIFNVTIANRTVSFSLKSSMLQRITPEIISFLRNVSNWSGVTLRYNGNQYPVWDPNDYTDMIVTLVFNGIDFGNLLGQHSVSESALHLALETALTNAGISQQCVISSRILQKEQDYIEFSISKPINSSDNLTVEVEKLVAAQNAGGILLNLDPTQGWPVSIGVRYRGTYDTLCESLTPTHTTLAPALSSTTTTMTKTLKPISVESETAPTCTNEYMELALPAHQLTHAVTSGLHWDPDPSCKATFNGTHYILRTGLYECGTKVTFDTQYVIFYNNVSLLFTHDGLITRDPDVVIHSICKYDRDEAVMSEFLPIPGGLEFVDEGFGQLSIRLDLFPTQSYLFPYTTPDYPVHKHLRDRMYLQLQVQGHARQLSVIALHCEATSGRNTSLQYPLIQDGCASDDTLQLYTKPDPATQRFSLEAFRFVQEVTTIHIRCEVEVCDAADTGSRCAQGCRTNRHHKRALEEQDDMKSRYVISRGPIILDADSQPEGASMRTMLFAGGSAMMITLAAVLVAVKVRRSKRVHPGYQQLINLDVE